MYKEN
jgi:magnesium-transporting ATPase (P-type)